MKKKIKNFFPLATGVLLFFPLLAFAQWVPDGLRIFGLPTGRVDEVLKDTVKLILNVTGSLAIIGFCIAGILYLTSAGDEDRQKTAKRAMVYSIIGVIIALSGLVIWEAAKRMLDGKNNF